MKKRTLLGLIAALILLILDSRCAADSAREALSLCTRTLIPTLFPLFVLGGILVPSLGSLRIPGLSQLLGFPEGGEGLFLLGLAGGYPLGAACVAQMVEQNRLSKADSERLVGLCSLCGPGFLFGVVSSLLSLREAAVLFAIQLESALLTAALWLSPSRGSCKATAQYTTLPNAVDRAIRSMTSVCAWVTLAAVAAGFLKRWLFPFLPEEAAVLVTGLLELTNGLFAAQSLDSELRFLLCAIFVSFGGVSVLLQIAGFGIRMGVCIPQKIVHALLSALLALGFLRFGGIALLPVPMLLFAKIAVEIPSGMVYNGRRKEGI